MSKPNIILIIGSAYSGSTALGLALHKTAAGQAYIGEFSRVPAFRQIYQLDAHDGDCTLCQIQDKACPLFSTSLFQALEKKSISAGYDKLAKETGSNVIIDASKHPEWLRVVAGEISHSHIKVLVSVRSPAGFIRSCIERQRLEPWQAANAWRDVYTDTLRTISRLNVPMITVRSEDFIKDRSAVLAHVASFANLKISKKLAKSVHAIGGNPAPYGQLVSAAKVKARAKELGPEAFDLNPNIAAASKNKHTEFAQVLLDTPGLCDLANILGYEFDDLFRL